MANHGVPLSVHVGPLEPQQPGQLVLVLDIRFAGRRVLEEERLRLSQMLCDTVAAWAGDSNA